MILKIPKNNSNKTDNEINNDSNTSNIPVQEITQSQKNTSNFIKCLICLENPIHPHNFECNHTFCFLCIYRHLLSFNNCPRCLKRFTIFDLQTNCKKYDQNRILGVPNQLFKRNENSFKKILKKYNVSTAGDINRLKWRFEELTILMENEMFEEKPKSINGIAWEVHKREGFIFRKKIINMDEVYKALYELKMKIYAKSKDI